MLGRIIEKARQFALAVGVSAISTFLPVSAEESYIAENANAKVVQTKRHEVAYWYGGDVKPKEQKAVLEMKSARDEPSKKMYLDIKLENAPQIAITYYIHAEPYVNFDKFELKSRAARTNSWDVFIPLERLQRKKEQFSEPENFVKGEVEGYLFGKTLGQVPLAGFFLKIKDFANDLELKETAGRFPNIGTSKVCTFTTRTEDLLSMRFSANINTKELEVEDRNGNVINAVYPPRNTLPSVFVTLGVEAVDPNWTIEQRAKAVTISFQQGEQKKANLETFVLNKYEMPSGFFMARDEESIKRLENAGFEGNPGFARGERLKLGVERAFISLYKQDNAGEGEFDRLALLILSSGNGKARSVGESYNNPAERYYRFATGDSNFCLVGSIAKLENQSEEQVRELQEKLDRFAERMKKENGVWLRKIK